MVAQYKLTYFDLRGLGEMSRMIFNYANVPFEDVRITQDQWASIKPTTPFGQVPVLVTNGVEIAQSYAIARLLAKRYGLNGKDDVEAAQLDSLADLYKDFYASASIYIYTVAGFLYKEEFLPAVEKFLPFFVRALKNSGSGFFAKSGVSWVDFLISNGILTFKNFDPKAFKKYPEILEHLDRVLALPQLKKYLSTRKETQM